MHVFIPSLQRPSRGQQKTAETLTEAGIPFTIIRSAGDSTIYPAEYEQHFVDAKGIAPTRQAILDQFGHMGKIGIVDDDMVFRVPVGDAGKTEEASYEQVAQMFEVIDKHLDEVPQVGVADRFRIHDKPKPFYSTQKVINMTYFNTALFPEGDWPKYRIPIFEDLDFTLQLFDRGLDNRIITEYCWSTVRNAKGGCDVYRNDELLTIANKQLCDFWPNIVRSINGVTRVHVLWKKCYAIGLAKKNAK